MLSKMRALLTLTCKVMRSWFSGILQLKGNRRIQPVVGLATAIGVSGITRHGMRVRFYSTVDLVNALEQEKTQGKAGRIAGSLLRMDLVILDELGYLPFSQAGSALLFLKAREQARKGPGSGSDLSSCR